MESEKHLYLMISRTDTGVGKIIRTLSRYPYNHVSLTLDPTFRTWVSFARYNKNTPLYAGFLNEPIERYLAGGEDVAVRIFRIAVSENRYHQLEQLFAKAGEQNGELIYNTFDILAAIIRRQIRISGAYTCLGFACSVLNEQFITIEELDRHLRPYLIYDGALRSLVSDSGSREDTYFQKLGLINATKRSAKCLASLCSRACAPSYKDVVADQL